VQVVKKRDCSNRVFEVATMSAVIAEDAPVLESREHVLDTRSPLAMAAPPPVAHDLVPTELRCTELGARRADAATDALPTIRRTLTQSFSGGKTPCPSQPTST
jgi:hypothetical protein